jgi:hypothetical protein
MMYSSEDTRLASFCNSISDESFPHFEKVRDNPPLLAGASALRVTWELENLMIRRH